MATSLRRKHYAISGITAILVLGVAINYLVNRKKPTKDNEQNKRHTWEAKICVLSFGCAHNMSDGETMRGLIRKDGYEIVETLEESDLVVINSCTVKNPSQDGAMNLVHNAKALGIKVVVGGCVPQAEKSLSWLSDVSLVGVEQLSMLPDIIERTLNGESCVCLDVNKVNPSLYLPKIRKNAQIEIIPINTGCLGRCTYCKTRFARGTLVSNSHADILERVREAIVEGVTQIWLTSEDTGAYGLDIDSNLSNLLNDVLQAIVSMPQSTYGDGTPRVLLRLGMTNPPYIKDQMKDLVDVFKHPHMFRCIHIPVQSGCDNVLENMIRDYTRADFTYVCDELQRAVQNPPMKFITDIICGFNKETEKDHQETLDLISQYKFDAVNISQFFPRPGTAAFRSDGSIDATLKKKRTRDVTTLFNSYQTFEYYKGLECVAWFSEESSRSVHYVGHTLSYVKVLVPKTHGDLIGKAAKIKVTDTSKWHIDAEIIELLQ